MLNLAICAYPVECVDNKTFTEAGLQTYTYLRSLADETEGDRLGSEHPAEQCTSPVAPSHSVDGGEEQPSRLTTQTNSKRGLLTDAQLAASTHPSTAANEPPAKRATAKNICSLSQTPQRTRRLHAKTHTGEDCERTGAVSSGDEALTIDTTSNHTVRCMHRQVHHSATLSSRRHYNVTFTYVDLM